MSSGSEPRTSSRCTIWTSEGPLKVELWVNEAPETSRLFLKRCAQGLYDGVRFVKKLHDAVIQTEDIGGESVETVESDSRIKMNSRGLLASFPKSKGAFFVTLRETSALFGKATVFGKLVDASFYNVIKICDKEMKPDGEGFLYPAFIEKVEIDEAYQPDFDTRPAKRKDLEDTTPARPKGAKRSRRVQLTYDEEEAPEVLDVKIRAAHEVLKDQRLVKNDIVKESEPEKAGIDASDTSSDVDANSADEDAGPSTGPSTGPSSDKSELNTEDQNPSTSEDPASREREAKTLELLKSFKSSLSGTGSSFASHELNFGGQVPDI